MANKMNKRNVELDRLRAFAVIMTIAIHVVRVFFPWSISRDYNHGTTILNIFANSWTGVDLFFVISGYIISKSIVTKIDGLRNSVNGLSVYIRNFFIRRIYRLYPVAWTSFFFVLTCAFVFNASGSFGTPENTIEAGISIFTYTFNYYFAFGYYKAFSLSPYWSLAVEEQFYLLLPFFIIFTKNNKQRVFILISLLFLISFFIRPFTKIESIFYTQTRCDGLIFGCLVYFISRQSWFSTIFTGKGSKNGYAALTFLLVTVLSAITGLGFSNNLVIPLACVISSLLVSMAAMEKGIIIGFYPIESILDYIGSRSYSLYVTHFPMMSLTQEIMYRLSHYYNFSLNSSMTFEYIFLAFVLTLLSSEILHRYVEIPFINKGRLLFDSTNERVTQNEAVPVY